MTANTAVNQNMILQKVVQTHFISHASNKKKIMLKRGKKKEKQPPNKNRIRNTSELRSTRTPLHNSSLKEYVSTASDLVEIRSA